MDKKRAYIQGEQKRITAEVTKKFKHYYLTGGTALAFHLKHRFSEDLDFFTQNYKREDPEKVMGFIKNLTGNSFHLEREQTDPKLVPLKIYYLQLDEDTVLKIDFVSDFHKNINDVKKGIHSLEDIYYRKIIAAIGTSEKTSIVGKMIPSGRQATKDFFDLYVLSTRYKPISDYFLEHFSVNEVELLIDWYKRFNRMNLQMDLLDFAEDIDTKKVLAEFDKEILKTLPGKMM